MTVQELIDLLSKQDPTKKVLVWATNADTEERTLAKIMAVAPGMSSADDTVFIAI